MFFDPPIGGTWAGWWYLVGVFVIISSIFISLYLVHRDDKRRARLCAHAKRRDAYKKAMEAIRARKKQEVFAAQREFDSQVGVATFYHTEK